MPDTSSEVTSVEDQIRGFRTLANGWCYGEGRPATAFEVESALGLVREMRRSGHTRLRAFPEEDGGMLIVCERSGRTLNVSVREELHDE